MATVTEVDVRIIGVDLPPVIWGDPRPGGCRYANIHVGVQRQRQVVELRPAGGAEVRWNIAVDVHQSDNGIDFRGPYVHGKRGDRFLYLSWGTVDGAGMLTMFRRAKLMLGAVDPELVRAATTPGAVLVGRLGLTGSDGGPRCAAVRPPAIEWTTAPP